MPVYDGCSYFFSRDAIVDAAFEAYNRLTMPLFFGGYGVISGEEMSRQNPGTGLCNPNLSPRALAIESKSYINLHGYTMVDFPNHHHYIRAASLTHRSSTSHVKVLGWRTNGDGYGSWGDTDIKHLFLRVADDNMYIDRPA